MTTDATTTALRASTQDDGRARAGGRTVVTTAVLLATAPTSGHGVAAAQAWEDHTIVRRIVDQIADIGVPTVHVITRTGWEDQLQRALAGAAARVHVHASDAISSDLHLVADAARESTGGLMVAYADIVTHREALAGLLADPRVASGVLAVGVRRPFTYRFRSSRGRIVSAASPYHLVHRPNASFLGVLKVSPNDRERLAEIAGHLERVTEPGVPDSWDEELGRKTGNMRVRLATAGLEADAAEGRDELDDAGPPEPAEPVMLDASSVVLSAEQEEEARFRGAVAREDVVSLLLVGLVRSGTTLASTHVRKLFWARPLSPAAVASAAERITQYDEEKVLLDSAVKATDGFFTTFFVSPYSKYIARLAARLGLTPNLVTTISVLIGAVAAAAFATGERWGMIAGAVLVHLAFVTDCVDGQLARYTRTFSKLGAWLDSVFDRTKEYVVFAGLALGATQMGDDVWVLAAAALTLQTVRHSFDFSYAAAQHDVIGATPQAPVEEPSDVPGGSRIKRVSAAVPAADAAPQAPVAAAPAQPLSRRILGLWRSLDRLAFMPWIKRMIAFPIGERFAVIAITAALWGPRTTFTVLLAWGGVAAAYTLAGRLLRSIGR